MYIHVDVLMTLLLPSLFITYCIWPCSNLATLHVHNAMLILRVCVKQLLLNHSEEEVIVQLDGAATIPQVLCMVHT